MIDPADFPSPCVVTSINSFFKVCWEKIQNNDPRSNYLVCRNTTKRVIFDKEEKVFNPTGNINRVVQ